jgi:hypothetical protein
LVTREWINQFGVAEALDVFGTTLHKQFSASFGWWKGPRALLRDRVGPMFIVEHLKHCSLWCEGYVRACTNLQGFTGSNAFQAGHYDMRTRQWPECNHPNARCEAEIEKIQDIIES